MNSGTSTPYRLLLIEDDAELAPMIVAFLSDEGFRVEWINNGQQAVDTLLSRDDMPDLIILDVMLPGLNGVEVCRHIREFYHNSILMLTAKDDELTEITSLNRGADGYLTKPVRPHVLLAHIKSQLRRSEATEVQIDDTDDDVLQLQDVKVIPSSMAVLLGEERLSLTTAEFQLLEYLMQHAGALVTRSQLYQDLRGIDYDGLDRSIDMRVSVLRKKLNDEQPPFRYIKTVRGRGYIFAK
ncbi:MAG: response regulator transcription factor [Pseudomonadota bacterium]